VFCASVTGRNRYSDSVGYDLVGAASLPEYQPCFVLVLMTLFSMCSL